MIITTGIQDAPVVCRLEIRDFLKDKEVTNLYVLAIDRMQKTDQTDSGSWFQLAAIHGRPYVPYDGVGQKGSFGGYCTHSSILFPTWHRPYLALFEQSIAKHIHEIAHEYNHPADKERYVEALERFRIPYWDWASNPELPDLIANQEMIQVHQTDGTYSNIKNPLYAYNFNPVYSDFGDGLPDEKTWESWKSTLRYPTSTDENGKSEPKAMQTTLRNNRLTLRDRTYNVLTQIKDYVPFSHDAFNGNDQNPAWYDSIEAIHGSIHGLAGRNGHMGVVDYAAFDPVFWMHHANVDRIFAIWQGLNPDAFVTPLKTEAGTFTRKPGEIENAESPLTPFRRSRDKFWDSNGVRDTRVFNYTYPELVEWESLSKKERSVRLRHEVNRLYGRTAPVAAIATSVFKGLDTTTTATTTAATGKVTSGVTSATSTDSSSPFEIATTKLPSTHWHETATAAGDRPHYHEWIANIVVEKYAVKTTFFVHIFLGDCSSDNVKWGLDTNLVGSHVVFANNLNFTGCEKCLQAHETRKLVTGTIPLTGCLGERLGEISKLEPETVVPYLKKNLHWRVQRHDNTPIENKDIPSLKITVGHAIVEIPQSADEFGTWGDIQMDSDAVTVRV